MNLENRHSLHMGGPEPIFRDHFLVLVLGLFRRVLRLPFDW